MRSVLKKNTSPKPSPVPPLPQVRHGSSLLVRREHVPTTPIHVQKSAKSVEVSTSGRGTGGQRINMQTSPITLRAPDIWDDAWTYEIDHHDSPAPSTLTPSPNQPGRDVVLFDAPGLPETTPGSGRSLSESPLKRILADINARAMTPREMQELSLDLYVGGILSWDEHVELAFQAELHPDFERTIGALTGEKPLPDQPRDFVREWEQRLDFERRFAPAKSRAKERALHILSVLRRIEKPTSLLA